MLCIKENSKNHLLKFPIIIFMVTSINFFSCNDIFSAIDDSETHVENLTSDYSFDINPRLPIDSNGYYHLTIDRNSWQTLHRVSGNVFDKKGTPVFYYWVEWESDLYWVLGDTLGYILHSGYTDDLIYVAYDTTYITGFNNMIVPTTNGISYSNSNGEINNMIVPVKSMIGDTMKLSYYTGEGNGYINIVLD